MTIQSLGNSFFGNNLTPVRDTAGICSGPKSPPRFHQNGRSLQASTHPFLFVRVSDPGVSMLEKFERQRGHKKSRVSPVGVGDGI